MEIPTLQLNTFSEFEFKVIIFIVIYAGIALMVFTSWLAEKKGYGPTAWLILGFFFAYS